jgi:hypothetical protein
LKIDLKSVYLVKKLIKQGILDLYNHFIIILIVILVTTCTENSLFDDKMGSSDGMTLRGTLHLDKDPNPDNIYIWLGILNLGTYSDTGGNFELVLPHPENQPQKGVSGDYSLFYYVANYKIDSSKVTLLNGKFVYNKSDINKEGVIRETITLKKLLTINASISPSTYPINYSDFIQVNLFIKNVFEPVLVQIFKWQRDNNMFTNAFFKKSEAASETIIFYRLSTLMREEEIVGERHWYMTIHTDSIRLDAGYYEIIPYIKVIQEKIPEGLLKSIGEDQVFVDSTYLNLPFKRQNTFLTVTSE